MPSKLLAIGTYNMSVEAVKHDPHGVKEVLSIFFSNNDYGVLGLNEAAQANWLEDWAYHNGLGYYGGREESATATPLLYHLPGPILRAKSRTLTDRTKVGEKPAGPTVTKRKHLNEIKFIFNGRACHVGCKHNSPSIWWPPNRRLIKMQDERAAAFMAEYDGLKWCVGDNNHRPNHSFMKPFERIEMRSTQMMLDGPIPTRKNRSIDDVRGVYDGTRSLLVKKGIIETPGDHDLYYTVSQINLGRN